MNSTFNLTSLVSQKPKLQIQMRTDFFSCIPGYVFYFFPTPLTGVGLFIHISLNYTVLEKTSNEAFPALWIEISLRSNKNITYGMIQHNSPDQFMSYFKETMEELTSLDKNVLIIGNFNIDLLKCETSQISHDFLMSLQSHYLIPTVHESIRVHRNSAMLIDIF